MTSSNRETNRKSAPGRARDPLDGYSGSTLDQITLICRILEGGERTPGVIVADYTISGEPGVDETATLKYAIQLPRNAVTYWQQQAVKAMPLYDGTVWQITLQTSKVARRVKAEQETQAKELASLRDELAAAQARIAELEEGTPR